MPISGHEHDIVLQADPSEFSTNAVIDVTKGDLEERICVVAQHEMRGILTSDKNLVLAEELLQ